MFNTILGGEAMSRTAHGPVKLWVVILTVVALVVALVGYDLIHKAEQWLTYLMIVIFGIFTITLFFIHYPAGTFDVGTFKVSPFFGQFGVVAGYQISWAIYVSDYSRCMPPDVAGVLYYLFTRSVDVAAETRVAEAEAAELEEAARRHE